MNVVTKVWNGSAWIYPYFLYPKVWNGSQWVIGTTRVWTGTAWNGSSGGSGGGSTLDTWTLTVGSTTVYNVTLSGYDSALSIGSLSPNTSAVFGGAPVAFIQDDLISGTNSVYFGVTSTATQSQFTTLTINGVSFSSSSATFYWSGTNSEWYWTGVVSSPFPALGQTCTVTLT